MAKKNARKPEKLRLLPDVPVGEIPSCKTGDGLGFDRYADVLARAALDTPEPFTIGVYGTWGSGKTSLMRMMMEIVEEEKGPAIPVWFNAWRYEREEHLIVPLLATILAALEDNKSKWTKAKEGGDKLVKAFRSLLYGVAVKGKVGVPGLTEAELSVSAKDAFERYQELNRDIVTDTLIDQSLYFRSFAQLDEATSQSEKTPRLVIFVDDLDRCFPPRAIALLEGIKLVLNQPNIAFVLGLSPRIIQQYIRSKYSKEYEIPEEMYEDYLEKLVQLAFQIPDHQARVESYVRSLLKREDVFGKIAEKEFKEEYEPLVAICGPACKDNPRAIVRFLNTLLIQRRLTDASVQLPHLGVHCALGLKWPGMLRALHDNKSVKIVNSEHNPDGEFPDGKSLCECIASRLDSKLVDVVPYFRNLANDQIEGQSKRALLVLAQEGEQSLRDLLSSRPGLEYLEREDIRRRAHQVAEEFEVVSPRRDLEDYSRSSLLGVNMTGAVFAKENHPGANFQGARLFLANLESANFSLANFKNADLSSAKLRGAVLQGARFSNARLVSTDFEGADLVVADLANANLCQANLSRANLSGADLSGTVLLGADFSRANLDGASMDMARYDHTTIWPEGFDPDAAGARRVPAPFAEP